MNPWHLKQASRALSHGGVIAYPTEAVWGLGCDPWDPIAVSKLLKLKQRSVEKGLILIAADLDQLGPLLGSFSVSECKLIEQETSAPITWLIPDDADVIPAWIKGAHSEVAIRVSAHSVAKSLCQYYGGMLVSTSANYQGGDAARSYGEVRDLFGRNLDYLLPGALGGYTRPSEIRSLRTGEVLRNGDLHMPNKR